MLGVVFMNPVAHEFHRHRDFDDAPVEALEFEALEPARIDFVSELCLEHGANLLAATLDRGRGIRNNHAMFAVTTLSLCLLCRLHRDYSPLKTQDADLKASPLLRRVPANPLAAAHCLTYALSINPSASLAPNRDPRISNPRSDPGGGRHQLALQSLPPHSGNGGNPPQPSLLQPFDCGRRSGK